MVTYFISDLHLHENNPESLDLFLSFLGGRAKQADAVYILGDLFEAWFGDDLSTHFFERIKQALLDLHQVQVPVFVMRGNRDFLISQTFCEQTRAVLLPDPSRITLYDQSVLITHGDKLCTLDKGYQYFRCVVQNPVTKFLFLKLPRALRERIGIWLRDKTKNQSQQKHHQSPMKCDVVPASAAKWMKKFDVCHLIHGHTHRPAIHDLHPGQRYVLGDWGRTAKILQVEPDKFELIHLKT